MLYTRTKNSAFFFFLVFVCQNRNLLKMTKIGKALLKHRVPLSQILFLNFVCLFMHNESVNNQWVKLKNNKFGSVNSPWEGGCHSVPSDCIIIPNSNTAHQYIQYKRIVTT